MTQLSPFNRPCWFHSLPPEKRRLLLSCHPRIKLWVKVNNTFKLRKECGLLMCKLKPQVCCLVCSMCLWQVEFNQQFKVIARKQTNFTTSVLHSFCLNMRGKKENNWFISFNHCVRYRSVVCILCRPAVLTSLVPKLDEDFWTQRWFLIWILMVVNQRRWG